MAKPGNIKAGFFWLILRATLEWRRQVVALLASDDLAASSIEAPALQVAAQALAATQPTEAGR